MLADVTITKTRRPRIQAGASGTLHKKWSKWPERHPPAINLNTQFDRRTSSERRTIV
ncbi:hypothetical protein KIN20_022836 [Parelaphostrongylus tenuis]|uniref:Uncharacterized protein n=1 Tax=Parelaphostrongylus tenuis TaxID=148309 RepID=A0AAD5QVM6_PARTN|nr:hypothetical protein KIN20_022836 [Parelaphostrongylus tenuis]